MQIANIYILSIATTVLHIFAAQKTEEFLIVNVCEENDPEK